MRTHRIRRDSVSWVPTDDVIVVLDLSGSVYLTLNESGTTLWRLLAEGATSAELQDALVEQFQITPEAAASDVDVFLDDLRARGLLEAT